MKKKILTALVVIFVVLLSACSQLEIAPNRYTLNFYNGSELCYTQTIEKIEELSFPTLTKKGYVFKGWQDSDGKIAEKASDLNLEKSNFTAVFEIIYFNISYELNGGQNDSENPTTYTVEEAFTFKEATKDNDTFLGWTTEAIALPTKNLSVTKGTAKNLNLTAVWLSEKYCLNSGENLIAVSDDGVFSAPNDPIKSGYKFEGWFEDEGFTQKIEFPYTASERITQSYPLFTPITYTISFVNAPDKTDITYTVETPTFTITAPNEQTGYKFTGYTLANSNEKYNSITIQKGSTGSMVITANFEKQAYRLTFDTNGGSLVEEQQYFYNDTIQLPSPPTKDGLSFVCWCTDVACTDELNFTTMPAEDITLYARWSQMGNTLNYTADASGKVVGSRANGSSVLQGESVTLSAEVFGDGTTFEGWYNGTELYCSYPKFTFEMPNAALSLTAKYESDSFIYYQLGSGNFDFTVPNNLIDIDGVGLKPREFSISGNTATIEAAALDSLEIGVYPLVLEIESAGKVVFDYVFLKVGEGTTVCNLRIDYDIAYPKVALCFDAPTDGQYEFSIDGSAYKSIAPGGIIEGYDKTKAHTVKLRNTIDIEEVYTVQKSGYSTANAIYYENYFTYNSNTYDFVVETEQELLVLLDYTFYVDLILNSNSTVYTREFLIVNDENLGSKTGEVLQEFIGAHSIMYLPSINLSEGTAEKHQLKITTVKSPENFGTIATSEIVKAPYENIQGLKQSSERSASFDDFKINSYTKTQNIRTIFELEHLAYGIKPIFTDTTQAAYLIYEEAKNVLRRIVDDSMDDYQKVAAIFDWIVLNITYDDIILTKDNSYTVDSSSFSIYGALIEKVAVCDGISSAFNLLCAIEGIESHEVVGFYNSGTGPNGHAWNKFNIDGIWYAADPTWARAKFTINSSTTVSFVNHGYLFMNEYTLYNNDHIEGIARSSYDEKGAEYDVVENVCFNTNEYFDFPIQNSFLPKVSNATELTEALRPYIESGATLVEIVYDGTTPFSLICGTAASNLRCQIARVQLSSGVYVLMIS